DRYESKTPLRLPHLDVRRIDSIVCSEDGTLFACGGDNYAVHVYDAAHGVPRYEVGGGDEFYGLCFSPGRKPLFSQRDKDLSVWDLVGGAPPLKYQGAPRGVDRAIVSADDRLVVGTGYESLAVWLDGAPTPVFVAKEHGNPTLCALSPDGA